MGEDDQQNEEGEILNLTVCETSGARMEFRVKKNTKLIKIFDAFAKAKVIQNQGVIRFMSADGDRLHGESTPKMMEMVDGDQIDCMIESTGGK